MTSDDDYDNNVYGIDYWMLSPITHKAGRDDVKRKQVDLEWYDVLDMNNPIGLKAMKQTFDFGIDESKLRTKTPNEVDAQTIYDLFIKWWDAIIEVTRSIPIDHEIELADHQKFAIALLAGVRIESAELVEWKYTVTLEPCAVVWNGTRWEVVRERKGCRHER